MTNSDRWTLYDSGEIHRMVAIELLDWAGYWTSAGIDGITDPLLKAQTKMAIRMILDDLTYCNKIVVGMVISDPGIKSATEVTESLVSGIVTSIMTYRLAWLTDKHEVD
ncbi:MAG: hypothetical protein J6W04_00145 [Bacteroidales bacterium]|nr:hypothetical protein [Bacteroidales bacterium]